MNATVEINLRTRYSNQTIRPDARAVCARGRPYNCAEGNRYTCVLFGVEDLLLLLWDKLKIVESAQVGKEPTTTQQLEIIIAQCIVMSTLVQVFAIDLTLESQDRNSQYSPQYLCSSLSLTFYKDRKMCWRLQIYH